MVHGACQYDDLEMVENTERNKQWRRVMIVTAVVDGGGVVVVVVVVVVE